MGAGPIPGRGPDSSSDRLPEPRLRSRPKADNPARGYIIPIGGAEDKIGDEIILKRFVEESGGSKARIAVIPTASELNDTGPGGRSAA